MNNTTTPRRKKVRKLDVREQCRLRLPVWFGSRDNFEHGSLEVLMNGNDEIRNNFDSGRIVFKLHDDKQTVTISDTGRGLPIDGMTDDEPTHELLFETLFAGTNYENIDSGDVTTGTNGCGLTVLNHTSRLFRVVSCYDGKQYSILYEDGVTKEGVIESDKPVLEHGTIVTFKLDETMYTCVTYDPEKIKETLHRLSGVSPTVEFVFVHGDEKVVYKYQDTVEYFEENLVNKITEVVAFPQKEYSEPLDDGKVELNRIQAMCCITPEVFQQTFLNYTYLKEDGAIYDGICDGLKKFFNKYNPSKEKFVDADIAMSFSFLGTVLSTNVEFENQTKFSTKKTVYKKIASEYIFDNMEVLKSENEDTYKKMLDHLTTIQKFNSVNKKKKQELVKKLNEKTTLINKIKKFVDCRTKDTSKRELYIVEGDSALGSCKTGRNAEFQALIPIRGKILNCLKADYERIFSSDIILDLVKVIGCGIEVKSKHNKELNTFNIDKLNYGKIIFCTDGDEDGFQIRCLLLVVIYILMPTLIEEGYIYIAETPLYEITANKQTYFAYSEMEKAEILNGLGDVKYKIQRSKGLGENTPEMMWQTTMNPETRRLVQITIEDAERMVEYFELFLGDNVENRKDFITEHGYKYIEA